MLSRREAVVAGSTAAAISMLGAVGARAQAAFERDPEVSSALAVAKERSIDIRNMVMEVKVPGAEVSDIEGEANAVIDLVTSALEPIPEENQILYTEPGQSHIAQEMRGAGIGLLPDREIPAIPPAEEQPAKEQEKLSDVIIDIAWETLIGEGANRKAFHEVLTRLEITALWDELAAACRNRDLVRAGILFEKICLRLLRPATLGVISEVLGTEAYRRLLVRVGARVVPFIGWALLVAAFLRALLNNWSRIQNAL